MTGRRPCPPEPLFLNWSDPLSQGLRPISSPTTLVEGGAWPLSESTVDTPMRNAAGWKYPEASYVGSGVTVGKGPYGYMKEFPNVTGNHIEILPDLQFAMDSRYSNGWTVSCIFHANSYSTSGRGMLWHLGTRTVTTPFNMMCYMRTTAGYSHIAFGSASTITMRPVANISALLIGKPTVISFLYNGNGVSVLSSYTMFVDGVNIPLRAATAFGAKPAQNTVGGNYEANKLFDGTISNFLIHNRILSPAETTLLHSDPYRIYRKTNPNQWIGGVQPAAIPVFAGLAHIYSIGAGMFRLIWPAATGTFQYYWVYVSTAADVFNSGVKVLVLPPGLQETVIQVKDASGNVFVDGTKYYFGMRADNQTTEDVNTVEYACTTQGEAIPYENQQYIKHI